MSISEMISEIDFVSIFYIAVGLAACYLINEIVSRLSDKRQAAEKASGTLIIACVGMITAFWYSLSIVQGSHTFAMTMFADNFTATLAAIAPSAFQAILTLNERWRGENRAKVWAIGGVDSVSTFLGLIRTYGYAADGVWVLAQTAPQVFVIFGFAALAGNTIAETFLLTGLKTARMTEAELKKFNRARETPVRR